MALPAGLGERWMGCRHREQAVPGIRERGAQEVGEVVWVSLILRGMAYVHRRQTPALGR